MVKEGRVFAIIVGFEVYEVRKVGYLVLAVDVAMDHAVHFEHLNLVFSVNFHEVVINSVVFGHEPIAKAAVLSVELHKYVFVFGFVLQVAIELLLALHTLTLRF